MNDLPLASVDRLIRKGGAERVSEDAAQALADVLVKIGIEIGEQAAKFAKHAGRKTVSAEDIKLAVKK
jgi:histone H3/H4